MKHLERALDGQSQIWKYIVLVLIAFLGGQLIGGIPLLAVILTSGDMSAMSSGNSLDFSAYGISSNLGLLLMLFAFVVIFFMFALLVKPFHKRTVIETINGRKRLRKDRIWMGMLVWGGIMAVALIVSLLTAEPGEIVLQFNLAKFIPLLLIIALVMPFQTSIEEILFRGYLAQGAAALTRNRWAAIIIPTVLFGLMHSFNPEVKEFGFWLAMPQYMLIGFLFGIISTLDDGIEIAMGMHFINNAFTALFTTHDASALQTDAVFKFAEVSPEGDLISLLIGGSIAFFALWKIYKWDLKILNKKVEVTPPPVPEMVQTSL